MAQPPRRQPPQKRKSGLSAGDTVASRAVLPKKRDRRQPGIFDAPLPAFIRPQLAKLVTAAPEGERWAHELKFDGYRMHARIDRGRVQLITAPSGLDWTDKYPRTAEALKALPVARAYLDGELCAVRPDGTTSFSLMQAATDGQSAAGLVYFAFDPLHLDGEDLLLKPLLERKTRLAEIMRGAPGSLQFSDHLVATGRPSYVRRANLAPKAICRSSPMRRTGRATTAAHGSKPSASTAKTSSSSAGLTRRAAGRISARFCSLITRLMAVWCTPAARAPALPVRELARLSARLKPLTTDRMPLDVPPPRGSRFGSPLVLSRVHWVRPELVAEVTYLTWTDDGLLRHVVYQGLREDKPAAEVGGIDRKCGDLWNPV